MSDMFVTKFSIFGGREKNRHKTKTKNKQKNM